MRIAKLFILYDSPSNPFRSLLAYAVDNSTLKMSIIAVSARHFANSARSFNQTGDTLSPRFVNANVDALHFKTRAIKALSSSLSHPEPSQKDATMAVILLLIFLDILESGIDGWKCHLHGAEGLVKISQSMLEPDASQHITSDSGRMVEETRRFVARQFSLFASSFISSDVYNVLITAVCQLSAVRSRVQIPRFNHVSMLMKASIKSQFFEVFLGALPFSCGLSVISLIKGMQSRLCRRTMTP